jgi:acetyl/propionyl-CoA carboxylase alpha subunit
MEVGLDYDPMLAKVVVWGRDRTVAIARMRRALEELHVGGLRTGAPAALAVLDDERFVSGDFDTGILSTMDFSRSSDEDERAAAVAAAIHRRHLARLTALSDSAGSRLGWLARSRAGVSPYPTAAAPDPAGRRGEA